MESAFSGVTKSKGQEAHKSLAKDSVAYLAPCKSYKLYTIYLNGIAKVINGLVQIKVLMVTQLERQPYNYVYVHVPWCGLGILEHNALLVL